ncbi:hypothetical protein HK098_002444 [Nowakowskiella sp. JEL0407]|nr:hypothetical protein HK098_002444 [Nowakowskiella sp. JEL0407]
MIKFFVNTTLFTVLIFLYTLSVSNSQPIYNYYVDLNALANGVGTQSSPFQKLDQAYIQITNNLGTFPSTSEVVINVASGTYVLENNMYLGGFSFNVTILGPGFDPIPTVVILCSPYGVISGEDTTVKLQNIEIQGCTVSPAMRFTLATSQNFITLHNVHFTNSVNASTSLVQFIQATETFQFLIDGCKFRNITRVPKVSPDGRVIAGNPVDLAGIVYIEGLSTFASAITSLLIQNSVTDDLTSQIIKSYGTFLFSNNAATTISNCQFTNSNNPKGNGGVFAAIGAMLRINDSKVDGSVGSFGGIVYAEELEMFNVTGKNTKADFAGALYVLHRISIFKSTFTKSAAIDVPFLDCDECNSVTISDSYIGQMNCTTTYCKSTFNFRIYQNLVINVTQSTLEDLRSTTEGGFSINGNLGDQCLLTIDNVIFRRFTTQRGIFKADFAFNYTYIVTNTLFDSVNTLVNPYDYTSPAILYTGGYAINGRSLFDNITITNALSNSIFHVERPGNFTLRNSNVDLGYLNENKNPVFFSATTILKNFNILIENSIFQNSKVTVLAISSDNGAIIIKNCTFLANTDSVIQIDPAVFVNSTLKIEDSKFINNTAKSGRDGGVINLPTLYAGYESLMIFKGNLFMNNRATKGAVFAVNDAMFKNSASFESNLFINNSASTAGGVFFIAKKSYCPDQILQYASLADLQQNNFAPYGTFLSGNPKNLAIDSVGEELNVPKQLNLYSGQSFPQMLLSIWDEFGQKVMSPETDISPSALIVISIGSNSSSVFIDGGICFLWNDKCILNGEVFGKVGIQNLTISAAVTNFDDLKSDALTITLNLTECPETTVSSVGLNSLPICRTPICTNSCLFGTCVGDDVCQCLQGYHGQVCSEKLVARVSSELVAAIRTFSCALLGVVLLLAAILGFSRENLVIKESSLTILLGSIIGPTIAYISLIILDENSTTYATAPVTASLILQRISMQIVFLSFSLHNSATMKKFSDKDHLEKEDFEQLQTALHHNGQKRKFSIIPSNNNKQHDNIESDVDHKEMVKEKKLLHLKSAISAVALSALHAFLTIGWISAPTSFQVNLVQISNSMFTPKYKIPEVYYAVVMLEFLMISLASIWSLRVWKLILIHRESRFVSFALFNWIICGPILTV